LQLHQVRRRLRLLLLSIARTRPSCWQTCLRRIETFTFGAFNRSHATERLVVDDFTAKCGQQVICFQSFARENCCYKHLLTELEQAGGLSIARTREGSDNAIVGWVPVADQLSIAHTRQAANYPGRARRPPASSGFFNRSHTTMTRAAWLATGTSSGSRSFNRSHANMTLAAMALRPIQTFDTRFQSLARDLTCNERRFPRIGRGVSAFNRSHATLALTTQQRFAWYRLHSNRHSCCHMLLLPFKRSHATEGLVVNDFAAKRGQQVICFQSLPRENGFCNFLG